MTNHPDDLLSAYIDKELDVNEHRQVEEHLRACKQCQVLVDELLDLQFQVLNAYRAVEAPHDMESLILQKIDRKSIIPSMNLAWLAIPLAGIFILSLIWFHLGVVLFQLLSQVILLKVD